MTHTKNAGVTVYRPSIFPYNGVWSFSVVIRFTKLPRPPLGAPLLSAGFPYKEETQRPIVSYHNIPNLINL